MSVESRSKAITFRLDCCAPVLELASGSYLPTSRVAGLVASGARSDQVVLSLGFCDAGVKKLATAPSANGCGGCELLSTSQRGIL